MPHDSTLLGNRVLEQRMTAAHHDLRARADEHFTTGWLESWRTGPAGTVRRPIWGDLAKHGFLGVSVAPEVGGAGLGLLGSLIVGEALAGLGDGGLMLGMHVQNEVAGAWLTATADRQLRDHFLPGLLRGDLVACQCDTDPAPDRPTTATEVGDQLRLAGRKLFVINAVDADLYFVSVLLDGSPALVLVERDRPGVTVSKVYDKLGTRGVASGMVSFDDVLVPAGRLVSRRGLSQVLHWNRVMSQMRFLIAADAWFLHHRLLAQVVDYAVRRQLGGRALAGWPVNAHALSRARADAQLMAAGVVDAYLSLERGANPVAEIAELKWFCVERATAFAALCCELEGGAGYMWDSPSLQGYAQLRGLRMAGGSQTTMLTIANHSFACRAEVDGLEGDVDAD